MANKQCVQIFSYTEKAISLEQKDSIFPSHFSSHKCTYLNEKKKIEGA